MNCLILGWNATLSAPLSSQLAAVLAGFVFTSIVFLISREGRKHSRALGLFCAAFVVLGFDSHLFGVLSGSTDDPFCGRVWTQAVTASGLLGTGAMAIIIGIIWLLPVGPIESRNDERPNSSQHSHLAGRASEAVRLNGIVLTMAYGVAVGVMVLLAATIHDYLLVVTHNQAPDSWSAWTFASPVIVAAITAAVALLRRQLPAMADRIPAAALKLATYGILIYALAGTIFVGVVGNLSLRWWTPVSGGIVAGSVASGLVAPSLLFVALAHAMPRFFMPGNGGRMADHATQPNLASLRALAAANVSQGQYVEAIPLYRQIEPLPVS